MLIPRRLLALTALLVFASTASPAPPQGEKSDAPQKGQTAPPTTRPAAGPTAGPAKAPTTSPAADASWKQWRGPTGTGYADNANPPLEWSETKNIRWKVAIPGSGHASPIVLGNRIYLMTAEKTDRVVAPAADAPEAGGGQRGGRGGRGGGRGGRGPSKPSNVYAFSVMALDRNDGAVVWRTTVNEEVPHEGVHSTSSFASISPVTDGQHIYAFFGSRGLFCLDMNGVVVWEKDLGDMQIRNSFGEGASPALYGDTLVVPWDHEGDSFVAAFDKSTGSEKWRAARDERTTWTTPVVVNVNGRPQAVVAGTTATIAYDLETGEEIWRCSGMTNNVVPTPVVGRDMIYLISGFRGAALQAVRLSQAKGDITGTDAIAWSLDRGTPYIPSPLLYGKNLYFLKGTNGIISCVDAETGAIHYSSERLENVTNVYSSPVGAGGHVFVCGREGDVAVIEDGRELKVIATNTLDEGIDATPAIVGDEIYLRGSKHLYCIARTEP